MHALIANRSAWILILALAFGVRVGAGVWWQSRLVPPQKFYFGDSDSYWELGRAIARGGDYEFRSSDERVFRAPGYPLLLAGLFLIFGPDAPVMSARVLGAVLGTVAVGIIGWWTTYLFDGRVGRLAGWIAALYPGGVAMSAFVLSEAPFCPFMLLELALWGFAWRSASQGNRVGLGLGAGAAGAAATLVRPSWLLFTPLAIAFGLATDKRPARQLAIGVAISVGFVICMAPWWVRNARLTGHFVATTLQFGASLYDGLNPEADGSSNMSFVPQFVAEEHAAERVGAVGPDDFEVRLNRRMTAASVDWAWKHPARVLELAGIKFLRIWNVWPNEPSLSRWPVRLAVAATYVPLLGLSLVGVWRFRSWGWPYRLAWLPAVYLTLVHVVFIGSIRYREPAMLALVPLAAAVLAGYVALPGAVAANAGDGKPAVAVH